MFIYKWQFKMAAFSTDTSCQLTLPLISSNVSNMLPNHSRWLPNAAEVHQ